MRLLILLHPPLPLAGVSTRNQRGCQQNMAELSSTAGPAGLALQAVVPKHGLQVALLVLHHLHVLFYQLTLSNHPGSRRTVDQTLSPARPPSPAGCAASPPPGPEAPAPAGSRTPPPSGPAASRRTCDSRSSLKNPPANPPYRPSF